MTAGLISLIMTFPLGLGLMVCGVLALKRAQAERRALVTQLLTIKSNPGRRLYRLGQRRK